MCTTRSRPRRPPAPPTSTSTPSIRHPFKKPKGRELTERQKTAFNALIRAVHAPSERANALLKETFAALQRVSLSPTRIGAIAKAALVLLHLEHGRPLPGGYPA
jgi:hypothetical protein